MSAYNHSRKGRIYGNIVGQSLDGVWVNVQLTAPVRGIDADAGEVITVRADFLTPVEEDEA